MQGPQEGQAEPQPYRPRWKPKLGAAITARERRALELLANGWTDERIARGMGIALRTVQMYSGRLFAKTGCHNRVELTRYAVAAQVVPVAWQPARDEPTDGSDADGPDRSPH